MAPDRINIVRVWVFFLCDHKGRTMPPKRKQKATPSANDARIEVLPDPRIRPIDWSETVRFQTHPVPGDGHCFFRALTCALSDFQDCGTGNAEKAQANKIKISPSGRPYKNHFGYRKDAIEALEQFPNISAAAKEEALDRLRRGAKAPAKRSRERWAEDWEMSPLAAKLGIRLFIYEPATIGDEVAWSEYGDGDREVYILNRDNIHFDALERIDGARDTPPAAASTSRPPVHKPPGKKQKSAPSVDYQDYQDYLDDLEARKESVEEAVRQLDASIAELEDLREHLREQVRTDPTVATIYDDRQIAKQLDAARKERAGLEDLQNRLTEKEGSLLQSLGRAESKLTRRDFNSRRDIARAMISFGV